MQAPDLHQWRDARRAELLGRRVAMPAHCRRERQRRITRLLVEGFAARQGMVIGAYWPFKGEFDPRPALRHFRHRGARLALPAVVRKDAPLQFREWWPGSPMRPGALGLPVPEGTACLVPQALLIPPIGFDEMGYRLGRSSTPKQDSRSGADSARWRAQPAPLVPRINWPRSPAQRPSPAPHLDVRPKRPRCVH